MKNISKRIIAFLSGVLLGLSCSLCLVVSADEPSNGLDILDDTRYSAFGIGDLSTIIDIINAIKDSGELSPDTIKNRDKLIEFALRAAEQQINTAADSANKTYGEHENFEPYTIKGSSTILCKRQFDYPYGGMKETDYLYIYSDSNATSYTPQQFGNYTITPNSMLLIRDTNFMGVKVASFPLTSYCYIGGGAPYNIIISTPPNEYFYFDTPDGQQLEYVFFASNSHNFSIPIVNGTTNTIRNDWLKRAYETNRSDYEFYVGSGNVALDDFEILIGTGYDNRPTGRTYRTMCQSSTSGFTTQPWFITCAYFNDNTSNNHINQYFSTDNNIDPSKPPAYVMPDNNPFRYNRTIDNSTINNYYDYGVSYNSTDNKLDIDPDILAGALGGLINPDFAGTIAGVYNGQPEIGLGFDTPLDLNLPDLVDDYLQSITVYPPSTGWEPPSYPAVNTSAYIPATYPTIPTNTLPSGYGEGVGEVLTNGWDMADSLGITAILVPIIIMLLLWRFTGKG